MVGQSRYTVVKMRKRSAQSLPEGKVRQVSRFRAGWLSEGTACVGSFLIAERLTLGKVMEGSAYPIEEGLG